MLSRDRLLQLFEYDPLSGYFISRVNHRKFREGKPVGSKSKRYRFIRIDKTAYLAHRLAFLYVTGSIPPCIDHVDGDGLNNKWENLRACTMSQNQANRKRNKNSKHPYRGIQRNKNSSSYFARISYGGVTYRLGTFSSPEEASLAYEKKAKELFGEFYRKS